MDCAVEEDRTDHTPDYENALKNLRDQIEGDDPYYLAVALARFFYARYNDVDEAKERFGELVSSLPDWGEAYYGATKAVYPKG